MTAATTTRPVVEMNGISITFPPGVKALDAVDFRLLPPGEVHTLMGENAPASPP